LVCQTVGGQFFSFCQNYMDAKLICQTVGVALTTKTNAADGQTNSACCQCELNQQSISS
jgi:hypothetical protein